MSNEAYENASGKSDSHILKLLLLPGYEIPGLASIGGIYMDSNFVMEVICEDIVGMPFVNC